MRPINNKSICIVKLIIVLNICLATSLAIAADAGWQLQRYQNETRERLREHNSTSAPASTLPKNLSEAAANASQSSTYVSGFLVKGITRFEDDEVKSMLSPYIGQKLNIADIHAAAEALQQHYRKAGYFTAKVLIPPQTFSEIIQFQVLEGYLESDGIEVKNKTTRIKTEAVKSILDTHLTSSDPMQRKLYERALLIAEDLPGVHLSSVLYPGQEIGTARLRTTMTDEPFFDGNIDFDNFGNKHTGRSRLGTTLYFNSPSGVGDQIVGRFVTTGRKSNYAYLTYMQPIAPNGTRLGVSVDYFHYKSDFINGLGDSGGDAVDSRMYITYPITRSRHSNLYLKAEYSHLRTQDNNDANINAGKHLNTGKLSLYGDENHDWLPNGTTLYEVSVTAGKLNIKSNAIFQTIDDLSTRTEGGFARLNFNLQRLQHLTGSWSLYGKISGQLATTNLDSSQKYYLGGGTSISGYPVGEIGGDRALEVHAELRREFIAPWGGYLHGDVFYQQGWVKQHHNTWDGWQATNPKLSNNITLRTIGIGATQTWDDTWLLRGRIGWQLGKNPVRDPLTNDASDGKDEKYRAWVQIIRYF